MRRAELIGATLGTPFVLALLIQGCTAGGGSPTPTPPATAAATVTPAATPTAAATATVAATATSAAATATPAPGSSLALFDQVWNDFDATYPAFGLKGVDWDAVRAAHRPNFQSDLTGDQFAERLADVLRELHDMHVNVFRPDGSPVPVYSREAENNYTSAPRNRYAPAGYKTLGGDVIHYGILENNIAYIRIASFGQEAFAAVTDDDIGNLFTTYADADGLIIDIRPNNGGSEENAVKFVSRLIDEPVVFGYSRVRGGPGRDELGDFQERILEPSPRRHFDGLVVGLIGQRCISAAESCALMLRAAGAILIGDKTRGSSGNPKSVALSNDVTYTCPRWIAYDSDKQEIEDRGIEPDIAIPAQDSFDSEHDYVVEEALSQFVSP